MPIKATLRITDQFLAWLFDVGTRVIESLNFILLLGFALKMLANFHTLVAYPSYQEFDEISNVWAWLGMIFLAIFQLIALLKTTNKSNQFSALILILSSGIWLFIGIVFHASNHASTAPVVYGTFAAFCAAAGVFMMRINKKIALIDKKEAIDGDLTQ